MMHHAEDWGCSIRANYYFEQHRVLTPWDSNDDDAAKWFTVSIFPNGLPQKSNQQVRYSGKHKWCPYAGQNIVRPNNVLDFRSLARAFEWHLGLDHLNLATLASLVPGRVPTATKTQGGREFLMPVVLSSGLGKRKLMPCKISIWRGGNWNRYSSLHRTHCNRKPFQILPPFLQTKTRQTLTTLVLCRFPPLSWQFCSRKSCP